MLKSTKSPSKNKIIWLKTCDSTSLELHRMLSATEGGTNAAALEDMHGTVAAALHQTNGRGQGDHVWLSPWGENLLFSVFLSYGAPGRLEAAKQGLLTMACSLATVDFLQEYGIQAVIKKPNDIYVDGRKICGMLIENSIRKGMMNWSIVGIGVNVNQTVFPEELPNPVSIRQLTGRDSDIEKCLNKLLRHLFIRFDAIWSDPAGLEEEYRGLLLPDPGH